MPQVLLLFCNTAPLQHSLKGTYCGGRRRHILQLMIDMLNEIDQKRRHIQSTTDAGILLRECVGIVVTPPTLFYLDNGMNSAEEYPCWTKYHRCSSRAILPFPSK